MRNVESLPSEVDRSVVVDAGYAARAATSAALFRVLRVRPLSTVLMVAAVALLAVAAVASPSALGAVVPIVLAVVYLATALVLPAALLSRRLRRELPIGSIIRVRIGGGDIRITTGSTTQSLPVSAVTRTIRWGRFVYLTRGSLYTALQIPAEALMPADPAIPRTARSADIEAAVDDVGAVGEPDLGAIVSTRFISDLGWNRRAIRALRRRTIPRVTAIVVIGVALGAVLVAVTGGVDATIALTLVVLAIVMVGIVALTVSIALSTAVNRNYPTGSRFELRVTAVRISLVSPRGALGIPVHSIDRFVRRDVLLFLHRRGLGWSWMPGDLVSDADLERLRTVVGSAPERGTGPGAGSPPTDS